MTSTGGGGGGDVHGAYAEIACVPSARMQPTPWTVTHISFVQPVPETLPWVHEAAHTHGVQ